MRLLIILFLFLTLNAAKAEVVSPTYVQTVASELKKGLLKGLIRFYTHF